MVEAISLRAVFLLVFLVAVETIFLVVNILLVEAGVEPLEVGVEPLLSMLLVAVVVSTVLDTSVVVAMVDAEI